MWGEKMNRTRDTPFQQHCDRCTCRSSSGHEGIQDVTKVDGDYFRQLGVIWKEEETATESVECYYEVHAGRVKMNAYALHSTG